MRVHLACLAGLVLGTLPGIWGQNVDPLSQFVSQAFSVYTGVVSALSVAATATAPSTTPTTSSSSTPTSTSMSSSTSSSSSASSTTSSSSSTFSTSISSTLTRATTSTLPASNTAEAAAAASSSAAAAVASMNAQTSRNRTIAIVLGVVLGLLALALLIGLALFCLRRRRRRRAVGSRRSVSREAVGDASWGKEPLMKGAPAAHTTPSAFSANERRYAPVGAATPLMAENTLHHHDPHGGIGSHAPIPHPNSPGFQPGQMDRSSADQSLHRPSPTHIPLSSHSRSNLAAAGLGGAAVGGLAAKHHHDKHDERDSARHPNDPRANARRKPVVGALDHRPGGPLPNMSPHNDFSPGYQVHRSGSPHRQLPSSAEPDGMLPSRTNGSPPAYNGTVHALSSHPPFEASHQDSNAHEPLMAGAAGVGAGALGGAALAKHHDGDREPDSALTGRRSWDPNRQSRNPQSILTNASNRRSTGSTNPYVQARSSGRKARFSDSPVRSDNHQQEEMPQYSPYPPMDSSHSPQQVRPDSVESYTRHGSPRNNCSNNMPGGWRGSGEFDRTSYRGSPISDAPSSTPQSGNSAPNAKNPSLSDLRHQEENGWYRGRYMGDDARPAPAAVTTPVDPSTDTGPDSRFYSKRLSGVGQAM